MSAGATALIACLVVAGLGIAATHLEELRPFRWLKIILSMPPTLMIAASLHDISSINPFLSAFSFGILALIWKTPIAHFGSFLFMRLINADFNRPSGMRAESGAAKRLHEHGDLDDALRLTREELEKDPYNYEGLLLLAQLYIDTDVPERALQTIDLLLANTPLTADQKAAVTATRKSLVESLATAAA